MKRVKEKAGFTFSGYILFFLPLAITVSVALVIFNSLYEQQFSAGFIALYMFLYLTFATFIFCVTDLIRRKIMVDLPAKKILSATERIASGDFSVRLTPEHQFSKYDRTDAIMHNINKMAEELGKSEILKTEFISNLSHEIKTPLSVIKNYATALKKGGLDKETKDKYLDVLVVTSERLSVLVTNILKLNKLSREGVIKEKEKVDATALLSECVIGFESQLEKKNITVTPYRSEGTINSVPAYLEIIFNNLLSNAIKFSLDGGKVDVVLKYENDGVYFSVKDYGVGMNAQTGARVFEKFYQGDTSHKGEGNGLGLALVKKVIDILGGQISVKSELGRGSEFIVILKAE